MKRILLVLVVVFTALQPAVAAKAKKPKASAGVVKPTGTIERDRDDHDRPVRSHAKVEKKQVGPPETPPGQAKKVVKVSAPTERQLKKANGRVFDLRTLRSTKPKQREKPEFELPDSNPVLFQTEPGETPVSSSALKPKATAVAPAPIIVFEGLDREFWGAGSPPDTNGDAGKDYYIQTVNTSVGVYRKSDGFREAAFTFDDFMSVGTFGNLCDTDNFGDPVVLYDTFEDRWVVTDFAFQLDGGGNPISPAFQCFAVSMNGNPLTGGWNFYSIQINDKLNDYPKLGVWTDGIYMTANMFGFGAGGTFSGVRVWAFNKAQMYAGSPTVKIVSFDVGGGDATIIPSNARLQVGTPPPGRPNIFISTSFYLNALNVYKFHVDWNNISLSTFTGPDIPLTGSSWGNGTYSVPQPGTAQLLDSLYPRAMMQNQYTNIGGAESLWVSHSVRRVATTGFGAPRWYQVNVTGGTVASPTIQAATWDPDAANLMYRWMPSVAVDRGGNLAMGYSTSNSTTESPSMKYAGRLSTDPLNTFGYTEQTLFAGTASQLSSSRWGDYSAMTLDPDGCTFWFTTEYATGLDVPPVLPATVSPGFNKRWKTKIGSFKFPECTPVGAGGTVTGTVIATVGGTPISGATVQLGARSTTTDGSGVYSFLNIPAGTYSSMTASFPGYVTGTASNIVVTDGGTTTQNFSLATAPTNACLTDTTQADFLTGVPTNVSLTASPGDIKLANPPVIDQQNTTLGTQGAGTTFTTWLGQTFTTAVSGPVVRIDLNMFSLNCGAVTMPNLVVSIRNAAGNLPTGADLAVSNQIPGFCNGGGGWFTATFPTPVTLTSGTQYAIVIRPVAAIPVVVPAAGYFWSVSVGTGSIALQNPYAGGRRCSSSNSGATWAGATGNANNDHGFQIYVDQGYSLAGNLVSSPKDSNPLAGLTPIWSTLSWNASTPANTSLQFQVAASNGVNGPFSFVGPDGTGATFFTTSPASLSQFYSSRFLEYKAYLATTNGLVTPTVNDVTVCYTDTDCSGVTATITPTPAQVCANSTGNSASAPAGMTTYAWGIANGTITSATNIQTITYTAGASGTVTLTLTVTAPNGCIVSSSTPVTINANPATPTITPTPAQVCANSTGNSADGPAGATTYAWSILNGTITSATNIQTITYTAGASGTVDLTLVVTNAATCSASNTVNVTINANPATPTITPTPTPVCGGSTGNTATGPAGATTYAWSIVNGSITSATNTQTITYTAGATGTVDLTLVVTNAATCSASNTVNVPINASPATPTITPTPAQVCANSTGNTAAGPAGATTYAWSALNGTITSATNAQSITYTAGASGTVDLTLVVTNASTCSATNTVNVTINPIPPQPTITPSGPTTFCQDDSVTLTSSSASGNQWYRDGNPISINPSIVVNFPDSGDYTVIVTLNGCSSPASAATTVTINPRPQKPVLTAGGPTTFCQGGSVTLMSNSATGIKWYLDGNPLPNPQNQNRTVSVGGSYTVQLNALGCLSQVSDPIVVTVNPLPATPTITPTPAQVCANSTGNSAAGPAGATTYAWSIVNGTITSATNIQTITYTAGASGTVGLTLVVTNAASCSASNTVNVTINANPATPTITPTPASVCANSTGNSAAGSAGATTYAWSIVNGTITSATNIQTITYTAGASGTAGLTLVVTNASSCSATNTVNVPINANPATPTITPTPAQVCASSTGNTAAGPAGATTYAWSIVNGTITSAANIQTITYTAGASGTVGLTLVVTNASSCSATNTVNVTINPNPNATITVAPTVVHNSTGNPASVANAGVGATYNWSITNGTITGGAGTANITFTAGPVGPMSLQVTVTTAAGCADTKSANFASVLPIVTVTSVVPSSGTRLGGTSVTINGTNFAAGVTVTFGGTAATNVVVVSSIKITAKTPAHAPGAVNVTVTNIDTSTGTLVNGYTYVPRQFDANNDGVVDPADIFFLVNYLFLGGPAPTLAHGDANGDGVIDPADIFYIVNFLFMGGPAPYEVDDPSRISAQSVDLIAGAVTLGEPVLREGRYVIPVSVTAAPGSSTPQAMSLRVRFNGAVSSASIQRAGAALDLEPAFETSRRAQNTLSYLVAFDGRTGGLALGATRSAVVAELVIEARGGRVDIDVDPVLTQLTNQAGTRKATVAGGTLRVSGTSIDIGRPQMPKRNIN